MWTLVLEFLHFEIGIYAFLCDSVVDSLSKNEQWSGNAFLLQCKDDNVIVKYIFDNEIFELKTKLLIDIVKRYKEFLGSFEVV